MLRPAEVKETFFDGYARTFGERHARGPGPTPYRAPCRGEWEPVRMDTSGIISAIITGLVVGALARLVLPGKQPIGVLLTIGVGFVGAFVGGAITAGYTESFWITFLVQVVVAAVLVAIVSAFLVGRGRTRTRGRDMSS